MKHNIKLDNKTELEISGNSYELVFSQEQFDTCKARGLADKYLAMADNIRKFCLGKGMEIVKFNGYEYARIPKN